MLSLQGLRVTYGDLVAVDDLDLQARSGEILALLGPNGAGKSSTVHCIVGLLRPAAGAIRVGEADALRQPRRARKVIGYLPEVARVYDALTPVEYLLLKGRLFHMDDKAIQAGIERLLSGFGLLERRHEPMVAFSKGMVQKVCLAAALLTEPELLILDEPLSGLDVETTMVVKEVMREFARRGGTVLYCSHLLDVVETLADRVAVLDHGRLLACGTMAELRQAAGGRADQGLEALFQQLTRAGDPVLRAREILGGRNASPAGP